MRLNGFTQDAEQYRDIDRAVMEQLIPYRVRMDKSRATWNYFTTNPQGGGFGSNHCGTQGVALAKALRGIPSGAQYELVINGKSRGTFTQP